MGDISNPERALLIVAASSAYPEALVWGAARARDAWGPIALESEAFDFRETDYYAASMGEALIKQFWAFELLVEQDVLVEAKRLSNEWEAEYARAGEHPVPRPLNLDPGYLTRGKLVLASTKDHSHRIYLRDGIYAEVTLYYKERQWEAREWTFPDYRRADYQAFFSRCREYLQGRLREDRQA